MRHLVTQQWTNKMAQWGSDWMMSSLDGARSSDFGDGSRPQSSGPKSSRHGSHHSRHLLRFFVFYGQINSQLRWIVSIKKQMQINRPSLFYSNVQRPYTKYGAIFLREIILTAPKPFFLWFESDANWIRKCSGNPMRPCLNCYRISNEPLSKWIDSTKVLRAIRTLKPGNVMKLETMLMCHQSN